MIYLLPAARYGAYALSIVGGGITVILRMRPTLPWLNKHCVHDRFHDLWHEGWLCWKYFIPIDEFNVFERLPLYGLVPLTPQG